MAGRNFYAADKSLTSPSVSARKLLDYAAYGQGIQPM